MHAAESQLLKILGVENGGEAKERGAGSSKTNSAHSHRSRNGVLSKRGTSVGGTSIVVQSKQSRRTIKKKGSSCRSVASGSNLKSPLPKTEQLLVSDESEDEQDKDMHGIIRSMTKTPEIYVEELA